MKKMLFKLAFSALVLLGIFTACKKSKDSSNKSAITRENLVGLYKIASLKYSLGGAPQTDYPFKDCEKDDQYKLNSDSTANYIDAGVKCNPPGDQSGTWQLTGNKITINVGSSSPPISGDIQSFDGTTLVVNGQGTNSGFTYTFTATLTKL